MTTTATIEAETITLAELCEAIHNAQISRKRLILRADAANIPAVEARINDLISRYEAMLDRDTDPVERVDNSYDRGDLGYGFHVLPRAGTAF